MTGPIPPCPSCGGTEFEPGFIDDAAQGRMRWFLGPMELGLFGNAKRAFKERRTVLAARCTQCSRLELFAGDPD